MKQWPEVARSDPAVMLAALRMGLSSKHVSPRLMADRSFVLEAVKLSAFHFSHASEELRADRDMVVEILNQAYHGYYALWFASDSLKDDFEIVLAVVTRSGNALQHASTRLRGCRQIVERAIEQDVKAWGWASAQLRRSINPYKLHREHSERMAKVKKLKLKN